MTDSIYNECWGCKWPGKSFHDKDCPKVVQINKITMSSVDIEDWFKKLSSKTGYLIMSRKDKYIIKYLKDTMCKELDRRVKE